MCTLKHTILLLATALLILGCEREGIVKIDDCQEVVQLETQKGSRPFAYLFTTFTCMYDKTTDKRSIIGGLCLARENAVFHSGCVKAAVYKRESDIHCPPHAHAMADGMGYCDDDSSGCFTAASDRRKSEIHCGPHAHANADGGCSCDAGYPLYDVHYQYERNGIKQYTNCTATAEPPAPDLDALAQRYGTPAPAKPPTICRYTGPDGRLYLTECP